MGPAVVVPPPAPSSAHLLGAPVSIIPPPANSSPRTVVASATCAPPLVGLDQATMLAPAVGGPQANVPTDEHFFIMLILILHGSRRQGEDRVPYARYVPYPWRISRTLLIVPRAKLLWGRFTSSVSARGQLYFGVPGFVASTVEKGWPSGHVVCHGN